MCEFIIQCLTRCCQHILVQCTLCITIQLGKLFSFSCTITTIPGIIRSKAIYSCINNFYGCTIASSSCWLPYAKQIFVIVIRILLVTTSWVFHAGCLKPTISHLIIGSNYVLSARCYSGCFSGRQSIITNISFLKNLNLILYTRIFLTVVFISKSSTI